MPSAEQFLRLLEEKDLVSAQVVDAARREVASSSPPPDAVGISLWLVQGHHITASQAERLLAAVTEKEGGGSPASRWQKGPPKPTEALPTPMPRPPEPPATPRSPEPPQAQRPPAKPFPAAAKAPSPVAPKQAPAKDEPEDFELAPIEDDAASSAKKAARSSPPTSTTPPPAAQSTSDARKKTSPSDKPKLPTIGSELESLQSGMHGPLDSLIESETLEASPFDDPMGTTLGAPGPKKFKLRRWIRNLFRRSKSKTVTIKATDPRQVKIVLFSWGVAAALVISVLAAAWFLAPSNSTKILRDAEAAVDKQDYGQAIEQYDKFVAAYPKAQQIDDVRTLRVLAELRRAIVATNASGNWTPASELAQKQVKELPANPPSDILRKIAVALGEIAEGVARQTQAKPDIDSLNRLRTITNVIETGTFANVKPTEMLEDVNRIFKQCKQDVEGRREVESTINDIRGAVGNEETAPAYASYRNLCELFPDLADDARVSDAMKEVSALEQKKVKAGEQKLAVEQSDRPSDLIAAMPLAVQPARGQLAGGEGKLRFVVEQGTAFGFDAASGRVLWRRFVASDPKRPAVTAMPIADQGGSDAVLCDPVHAEVLRVKGRTGEIVWRLAVGHAIVGEPVRAGRSLLAVTEDKRLLFIDLASGASNHYLQLPQQVRLAPIVDVAHGLIYLVAESSNLYVFSHGKCQQVVHLGHDKGAIVAAPAVVGDFLVVPVNDRGDESTLRVLSVAAKEAEPLHAVQRIRVKGYLNTPPAAMGEGAVVATAQGGIVALQRDADAKAPFHVAAKIDTALEEKALHFVVSDGHAFWVTGKQLSRYTVEADQGQISLQKASDAGLRFDESPEIEGATMFNVTHRPGMPGATVSAVDLAKGEPVWQTWLGAPLAATPEVDKNSGKLTALTTSGGMFRLPPAAIGAGAAPQPPVLTIGAERLAKPLSSLLALAAGRYALTSGADTKQIVIYDPQEQDKRFRFLLSPDEMAAAPGAFASGLLTPCSKGQVALLDPTSGEAMAKAYVPSLSGVTRWRWCTPQAADDKLAVLCDGDRRVLTVQIAQGDEPSLAEAATAPLSKRAIVSPIAILGKTVYVVDAGDTLLTYRLPDLSPGKQQDLGGHLASGPERVGKFVLVSTDKNRLLAVDEEQKIVWQADLHNGPLAGTPFIAGDDLFVASQSGIISRHSAADGKELGKSDAGCPLGTGPVLVGSRLIAGGSDGSLLEVKKP